MDRRRGLLKGAAALAAYVGTGGRLNLGGQQPSRGHTRLAELEIDPGQLAEYKAALKEEIETSLRVEPGVLALNAVSLKDQPNQVRIFESYASVDAYKAHLETAHFMKYKTTTQGMVKSLKLHETEPITTASKDRGE